MFQKLLCALACAPLFALAAPPAGTITSGGSLQLNGTEIAPSAAVSVPFQLGDRLSASDSQVVLRLDEFHAVVTLSPHSSVQTGTLHGAPFVRLVTGSMQYNRAPSSRLVIFHEQESVSAGAIGAIAVSHQDRPAPVGALRNPLPKRSKLCPDGAPKDHDCGKNH